MSLSIRDSAPREAFDDNGEFSIELYMQYARDCNSLADSICGARDVSVEQHKILVLVDLQGVYLAVVDWLKVRNFILESGLIISRLTLLLLTSVLKKIESNVIDQAGEGAISFEDVVNMSSKKDYKTLEKTRHVIKFEPTVELFYAPAPLEDLVWRLRKEANQGSVIALDHLEDVIQGIIPLGWKKRDYQFYEEFVECLKHDPLITRSERGFFNFYVGKGGIAFIDEKEVDIRIAIRAVDACTEGEMSSICIVSSDQDFLPLHDRCAKSGARAYQADVAKSVTQERVGRELKNLGDDLILTEIDPSWPLKMIVEACAPFAIYKLSEVVPENWTGC